jgi:hypothetical protein
MRMRIFGVALLAVALSGCWVFDELNEGNKKMDLYMKKKPDAEADAAAATAGRPRAPRATEYFANQKNARTLTPGTVSTDIVGCKLKSGTQFMKATDCVNRGGVPSH